MRLFNVIETVLNCLYMALEIRDCWRSIFLFLRRSSGFWPEIRPYASGCMVMQPGKIYLSRTGRCIGWFVAGFT